MKERPILFNTEMVKAILNGSKTQSRRPFSKVNIRDFNLAAQIHEVSFFMENGLQENDLSYIRDLCQFGQIGDRLYVRETWRIFNSDNDCGCDGDCNCKSHNGEVLYYAEIGEVEGVKWNPSIHMPKKYARIWLEVTDIRVEKVQDISEKDAQKEGFRYEGWSPSYNDPDSGGDGEEIFPRENFCKTWEKIYGKENLWVWVIEFKVIKQGE